MTRGSFFILRKAFRFGLAAIFAISAVWLAIPTAYPTLPVSTVVTDAHDEEIAELVYDRSVRRRPVGIADVPEFFRRAIVGIEDRHYYGHLGISPTGIGRALYANLVGGATSQGASTITAQYVRNALWITARRSFGRKIAEFALAFKLSLHASKDDVLERYLNTLSFGRLAYGPESAARAYFGRPLAHLTPAEQLALVTIAKNPARYDPIRSEKTFRTRFVALADRLAAIGAIDPAMRSVILAETLAILPDAPRDGLPYVRDFVSTLPVYVPGRTRRLSVSVDADLTRAVQESADRTLDRLRWKKVSDYAVVIFDRSTMALRVMIGGENYAKSDAGQVNSALAPRQPGSTIKPFTYLLAREKLGLKPDDTILDLPVSYRTAEGYPYEPKNYSLKFSGEVSAAQALAESINVPAVKVAEDVGLDALYGFLRSVGISTLTEPADHYGLALTLGDAEMSLYELTRAYSVFARAGEYCEASVTPVETPACRRVADAAAVADIAHVLSNRYYKLRQYPLYSALDFSDRFVFWKTGTSRNFRDNWTVGYTDRYLVGVWSGNKSGENMQGVSGATGAGEIFGDIVRLLEPAGAPRDDAPLEKKRAAPYLDITAPLPETRYALDPARRPQDQAVRIEYATNMTGAVAVYRVDGAIVTSPVIPLSLGRHTVSVTLMRDGATVATATTGYAVDERPPSMIVSPR